jgi:uncharacterized protein
MHRKKYDHLASWQKRQGKPIILMGARQVGKTYLLKQFARENYQVFHYFNFEESKPLHHIFENDLIVSKIIGGLELVTEKKIEKSDLIIFDEIQECPQALTSLKYFCENSEYRIIAAGSLLGLQLSPSSFPVGKVEFEYLYPMSFEEFLKAKSSLLYEKYQESNLENIPSLLHEKLNEAYLNYLFVGGMPEAVKSFTEGRLEGIDLFKDVRRIQKNILKGYLADFAKHSGKVNSMHIERVWQECAIQIGLQKDESVKRFRFRDVLPGKKQYLEFQNIFNWLEKEGLIHLCRLVEKPEFPLAAYTKESLFKAYLFDSGILGAMLGISPAEILHSTLTTYKGFIAENYMATQLKVLGHESLYYWQGRASEIEFIINKEGSSIPIEVKSGHRTHSKSLSVYREKFNPVQTHLFSMQPYFHSNGQYKIPLWGVEKFY